jgi:hypothetical protein
VRQPSCSKIEWRCILWDLMIFQIGVSYLNWLCDVWHVYGAPLCLYDDTIYMHSIYLAKLQSDYSLSRETCCYLIFWNLPLVDYAVTTILLQLYSYYFTVCIVICQFSLHWANRLKRISFLTFIWEVSCSSIGWDTCLPRLIRFLMVFFSSSRQLLV